MMNTHRTGTAVELVCQQVVAEKAMVWQQLGSHPNCVRLIETVVEQTFAFFVMERCSLNFSTALQVVPDLNGRHLSVFFLDMIRGLGHCHSLSVAHLDLKPESFLVSRDGVVKLCNFSLAAHCPPGLTLSGACGTAPYMSPEMLKGIPYTTKTDVWSLGVTLYVLLFGAFPYMPRDADSEGVKRTIRSGVPPPSFSPPEGDIAERDGKISSEADVLVRKLVCRSPGQRFSVKEALQSQWLCTAGHVESAAEPSFRPMLRDAIRRGVFERRDLTERGGVDQLLSLFDAPFASCNSWPCHGAAARLSRSGSPSMNSRIDPSCSNVSSAAVPKRKVAFPKSSVSTSTCPESHSPASRRRSRTSGASSDSPDGVSKAEDGGLEIILSV